MQAYTVGATYIDSNGIDYVIKKLKPHGRGITVYFFRNGESEIQKLSGAKFCRKFPKGSK